MSLQSAFTVPHERHDYDPRQSYRSGAYSYDRRYGPNENDGNHEKRKTGTSDDEHSQRFLHHDLNTHRPIIPGDSSNPDMSPSAFAVPHERHDYHPYSMNALDQSGYYFHPGPYFQGVYIR